MKYVLGSPHRCRKDVLILGRIVTHAFVRPGRSTYFVRHVGCATSAFVTSMLSAHGSVERVPVDSGMDTETVSYVLGMFLCYPLGVIMLGIPYGKARHLFSFLLGAFLLQFFMPVW